MKKQIKKRNIALCIIFTLITCGIYWLYWVCCLADDVNEITGHQDDIAGWKVLLFDILTCGIYGIYWSYKLGKKLGEKAGDTSGNKGILFLVLSILGLNIVALCIAQSEVNDYIE